MAESIIKLIVDAANAIAPLKRVRTETARTEKQVSRLQETVKAQSRIVEVAAKKMERFGRIARVSFRKAERAARKFQSGLGGLKGAIVSLGVATLTKNMIGQAASFAQTQVRLKALSSEYGEFDKIQQLVKDNAKTFNQSTAESASNFSDAYARLRPLGTSLEEIQTVYKGFNATALASGTSAEAASGAFLQLSQALGSGRLQGDEFRSIAEQVPGILRLVSDEMGVTVGQLKQLGSDGKITSDILIKSLAKGFELNKDKIQALLAESPAQKFKEFSNATSALSNSVGTELLPVVTPTVEALTGMVRIVGRLPGPVRTLTAAVFGLAAAFTAASGAAGALGIKIKVLLALGAKVALVLAPFVGIALAIEEARVNKENFDEAINSGSLPLLDEQLKIATNQVEELTEASKKFEDSPYYRGKVADVEDLKKRLDEAKLKVEELTKRRTLVVDIVMKEYTIAGTRYKADGPGGRLVPIDPPKTVTEIREEAAAKLKEQLGNKPSGRTGRTGPDPAAEAKRKAEEDARRLKASFDLKANAYEIRELEIEGDERQKIRIAREYELNNIEAKYGELITANLPVQEKANLVMAKRLELGNAFISSAKALEEIQNSEREQSVSRFEKFFQDAAAIDKEIFDKGAKMRELYASIGETISTGIVDSLTAAVEGTKSLAEVASDTLRSLANILLKFGVNSLLGGLGSGGGFLGKLFGGFKADGGTVNSGKSYIVGERGPELFTPGRSGSIAPNSSMSGANVVVNVDASGSKAEGDTQNAKQLGSLIGAAVQAELVKQQRPGGILAS